MAFLVSGTLTCGLPCLRDPDLWASFGRVIGFPRNCDALTTIHKPWSISSINVEHGTVPLYSTTPMQMDRCTCINTGRALERLTTTPHQGNMLSVHCISIHYTTGWPEAHGQSRMWPGQSLATALDHWSSGYHLT